MPKILGVDYGERRTGVAVSDDSRTIAFPRETLECPRLEQAAAAVARLAEAEQAAEIVVGYPLNMNGSAGARTARTDEFLAELAKRTAIPLRKWDERLSTKIAEDVLIEAGSIRFKPILLTALAAIIGAAVILTDPIFQGLAISLLFGLISSTLLTLLVIPAIYRVLRT